jgi:hypothetical protein
MDDELAVFALILEEESFVADFSLESLFREKVRTDIDSRDPSRAAEKLVGIGALVSLSGEHDVVDYLTFEDKNDNILNADDLSVSSDNHYFALGPQSAIYMDKNYVDLLNLVESLGFKTAENNLRSYGFGSGRWTGRQMGLRTSAMTKENLRTVISMAKERIEGLTLTNAEAMQAKGLIEAAERLIDLPDPPEDLIWQIIARLASILGIAQVVVAIFEKISGK